MYYQATGFKAACLCGAFCETVLWISSKAGNCWPYELIVKRGWVNACSAIQLENRAAGG